MKQFRKFICGLLSLSTALTLSGMGIAATVYASGQLTSISLTLNEVRSAQTSNYAFSFHPSTTNAAATIKAFKLQWRQQPSTSSATPDLLDLSGATGSSNVSVTLNGGGAVSFAPTIDNTNKNITISDSSGITTTATSDVLALTVTSVVNNTIEGSNQCDTIPDTDTCYVWITTYSDAGATTVLDTGVASYTVTNAQTVTATVDPSLAFTVGAVTASNIATNDSNSNCTISAGSIDAVTTTTTTLPFGNVRVGVAKCAQQSLKVQTNANGGYDTYFKFLNGGAAAAKMMYGAAGATSSNVLVPFEITGTPVSMGSPQAFTTSSLGTNQNVDSGMLGIRTTNAGIGGFGSNLYAGPAVGASGNGNKVMTSSAPDNGNTLTYVTFKLIVNAFQPADQYTGSAFWNVVSKF